MSDIFDDVEKMLADSGEIPEGVTSQLPGAEVSETDEANVFNESELEDIMAEIESLESDFEESVEPSTPHSDPIATIESSLENVVFHKPEELVFDSSKADKTDLQRVIDQELEAIAPLSNVEKVEEKVEVKVKAIEPTASPENESVIAFEKTSNIAPTHVSAPMSFQASGNMNLNLNFKLGEEDATLFIDEVRGLVVSFKGVEVTLNELNGCTVTMENGINFTIPLTPSLRGPKKKVA
jgi:hypothetical protein